MTGINIHKALSAAQGYLELGMYEDAHRELNQLSPEMLGRAEFLECRLFLYMQQKRWEEALGIAAKLRRTDPHIATGYIQAAFCLHEMGRTQEAKELLIGGPEGLRQNSLYHYNLACYEAVLGEPESALEYLKRSFLLQPDLREVARDDSDLKCLRGKF
jgi:tetratricopeptide (TPR) repeat protein